MFALVSPLVHHRDVIVSSYWHLLQKIAPRRFQFSNNTQLFAVFSFSQVASFAWFDNCY